MPNGEIYSLPEAAALCNLSRGTLWKYVKQGQIKAFKTPGGQNRIHISDLKTFMQRKGIYPYSPDAPAPKKVLIVDDDLKVQKLLRRTLDDGGFELEFASDGFEAGLKIAKFQPHVIVLDLVLPEIDGFKVCRQIKRNPDTRHIKVIAISGVDPEKNKDRVLKIGADRFFTKPLEMKKLLIEVEKTFEAIPRHAG